MAGKREITVDGQRFLVKSRGSGCYDYDWVNGPNPGYGFTSRAFPSRSKSVKDHHEAIKDFLSGIDPETGYLSDGDDLADDDSDTN